MIPPRHVDENNNPVTHEFKVMQGAWMRTKIDFKVLNNHCIGLKSVTNINVMKQVFKEEEIFGAYRADPNSVQTAYSQWSQIPDGFMARWGHFEGLLYFSDVHKIIHLQINLKMKVSKHW